jgi:predicted nucleic acid-binding Zn ribbon protein
MSVDRRADDDCAGRGESAGDGAASGEHDPTGLDVARSIARSLKSATARAKRQTGTSPGSTRPGFSGARPDGRDPALIGAVLDAVVEASGWEADVAVRSLFARWPELVGREIAEHCHPTGYAEAVLRVRADSTAWATQLRLLAPAIVRRLNEELGHGNVSALDIAGPDGPSWSAGRRAVRGGRGPRDTYG